MHRSQGGDLDIVGLARDGDLGAGVVLKVRSGLLLGRDAQRFAKIREESEEDLLSSLVSRHYLGAGDAALADLPRQVLLPRELEDRALLAEILTEGAGRQVVVTVPQRGEKLRLIELAEENARHVL